jgi:hypothetical protein
MRATSPSKSPKVKLVDAALLAGVVLCASAAMALSRTRSAAFSPLAANPDTIELGAVNQREGIPFEITLRNNGDRPIVISEGIRPCSCTKLELETGSRLAPHATLRVPGTLDTRFRRGPYAAHFGITYCFEGAENQAATIPVTISTVIEPRIIAQPSALSLGANQPAHLVLTAADQAPFVVNAVQPSDRCLSWESERGEIGREVSMLRLRIALDEREFQRHLTPSAASDHHLEISTTESSEPAFRVPLTTHATGVSQIPGGDGQ